MGSRPQELPGTNPLAELIYGKGGHASPVACVEDLSAELAGSRVSGSPYSVWQIVKHLNYWMDYELKRMDGRPLPYPEHAIESWPTVTAPSSEEEWKKEVSQFSEHLQEFVRLSDSGTETLARSVEVTTRAHTQQCNTMHAVLWQTAVHNSYHIGQIVLIRRCLKAWPPRGGGDTW